jgi:predicted ribosomally synthesized peptide with SipW-like signal peptide
MIMRTKNMLLTAAVIGLAVVGGLLGVGGTWALWNASVQSNPGTVQAANFDIQVNGTSIPPTGTNVSVDLEGGNSELTPTRKVYAAVTITNATNASGPLKVGAELGAPQATGGTGEEMRPYLDLSTAPLSSGACSALSPSFYAVSARSVDIPKDRSATFCVEVALKANAPSTLGGKSFTVSLPLSVSQLPAGA